MRREIWRRLPDDPSTPLGWWRREARSPFRALGLIAVLVTMIAALGGFAFLPTLAVGTAAGLWVVGIVVLRRKERRGASLAHLAPSPAPVEAFPVEFTLLCNGVCTGRDMGIASFVDGWLHVEGRRTGFSIRPIDVTRGKAKGVDLEAFDLPGGQRIEFSPLGTAQDRATFGETARVWHRFTIESPPGEPQLPPLRVHPSAYVRPLTWLCGSLVGFPVFLGSVIYFAVRDPSFLMAYAPLSMSVFQAVQSVLKAHRDLRRLSEIDLMAREAEARAFSVAPSVPTPR